MKPAYEKRVLRELEGARQDMAELEPLLLVAMARADMPSEGVSDPVRRRSERVVRNALAVARGLRKTCDVAKGLSEFEERT